MWISNFFFNSVFTARHIAGCCRFLVLRLGIIASCFARLASERCLRHVTSSTVVAGVQIFIHRLLHRLQHLHQVSRLHLRSVLKETLVCCEFIFNYVFYQGGMGAQSSRGSELGAPIRRLGETRTPAGETFEKMCWSNLRSRRSSWTGP